MPSKFLIGGLLLMVLISFGCKPEVEQNNLIQDVVGHWDVTQAIRNKKPTTTLEDAYFEFKDDKTCVLNLNGADQSSTFEINGNVIKINGTSLEGDFKILKLQKENMILSTTKKLSGNEFNFIFHMMKKDSTQTEES